MAIKQKKTSVIATTAQKVMTSMANKKALDEPDTPAHASICSLEAEKTDLQIDALKNHIHSVNDKHAWAIFLDEKLLAKHISENGVENYLIGYENGKAARRNETHFSQKENDPVSHRIIFQPEPYYISYSFFYGFFAETVRNLCLKTLYGADYTKYKKSKLIRKCDLNITVQKEILKRFNEKYTFAFTKNPALTQMMSTYAEILIENMIEVRENLGSSSAK